MKRLNKKGFTLVELLAVVVVLAIVAAIAMRSITTIIKNNRIDSFISSLNSVIEGAEMVCVQDGNLNNITNVVDPKGIIVTNASNLADGKHEFTVAASTTGEFKNLTNADIQSRIGSRLKGVSIGNLTYTGGNDAKVNITVKYTNECNSSN